MFPLATAAATAVTACYDDELWRDIELIGFVLFVLKFHTRRSALATAHAQVCFVFIRIDFQNLINKKSIK